MVDTREHIITLHALDVILEHLEGNDLFQFYVRQSKRLSLREALAAWLRGVELKVYVGLTRREAARLNLALGRKLTEMQREMVRDSRDATCGTGK